MATKKQTKIKPVYLSAFCAINTAVDTANAWDADDYTVVYCFPTTETQPDGEVVAGIYMLGRKRDA